MTQQEKDIKSRINRMIEELMKTDNVGYMKRQIADKLEGMDIGNQYDLEVQCRYTHLINLFNIITGLEHKSIQHVKAGMRDYKEQDNPLWMNIIKNIAA